MGADFHGMAADGATHRDGPSYHIVAAVLPNEPTHSIIQSGPLARIIISRTVLSRVLSSSSANRFQSIASAWFSRAVVLFWIGQCLVIALPLMDGLSDSSPVRILVAWIGALISLPALTIATAGLNLDVVNVLLHEGEFRCGVVLNTIQWIIVAVAFDLSSHACICLIEWWVVQLAFLADADFRLCGKRLHLTPAACVVSLAYLSCSLTGLLQHSFRPMFTINRQSSSVNDILQWTAPTLCIVLLKHISHSSARRRRGPSSAKDPPTVDVYCSMIKARLELAKVSGSFMQKRSEHDRDDDIDTTDLVRSNTSLAYVDITNTLTATSFPLPEDGITNLSFALLYSTGVLSFTATCVATFLSQIHAVTLPHSRVALILAICSLIGTAAFCGLTAQFYHRQVLRQLSRTFDVVFSSLQFLTGALLMCELFQWDARCVNVITWTIWFHWILFLDALTPPIRAYLRLKKLTATPAALFILYGFLGPFVLLYGYTNTKLFDRELVAHIRISTVVVARMLTLWMWSAHLIWDLGVRDDDEFIFLKDSVQYAVPRDALQASPHGPSLPANAVLPAETIRSPHLPTRSMTPGTPAPSPEPSPTPR